MENILEEIQVSYNTNSRVRTKINCPQSVYELLLSHWNNGTIELQEEFKVLLLNRANTIIGIYNLSKGGCAGTVVDVKLLFAVALKCNASAIIVSHNHPSGNLTPSEQDEKITKRIKEAGKLFDIVVLDHLIVTKFGFYSFANEGKL
ncbi:JAB domain-containing protein [Flavobacterium columnare]|uniref:DNA repair protein n=1 Tax=Flavobacterium columnare TaxID=996 RepID=A0AAI8CHC0_9FLAO|nr:JAB domain-containing protein [Flavobacterium columnare]AMO20729.1 DNA repair protein [Flavobacterium columnare]AUX18710.1 DNA repair protein [Flavobacterium columnare]QOG57792.1 JAB domain-containing protein [Flavobacterium columnare]QOG60516.1 JAB domain-containing protein [Flavobacterium columnare]QOG63236.1 JAB domain-containing protein [Flavobacterium columnare]